MRQRSDATMAVTCDDPGVRLFLDRSAAHSPLHDILAAVGLAAMTAMLVLPVATLGSVLLQNPDEIGNVPLPIWAFAGVFTLLWISGLVAGMRSAILATRRLQRFHV